MRLDDERKTNALHALLRVQGVLGFASRAARRVGQLIRAARSIAYYCLNSVRYRADEFGTVTEYELESL